jgi:hypothetical protein
MLNLKFDQDELLQKLASESIRKGEDIRAAVRDVTLRALQGRQMTLTQIRGTLRDVAEGVNLGAVNAPVDPQALVADAFAGMDEALLQVVDANRIALHRLASDGFEQSQLKRALDELERYEDALLSSVKQASTNTTDNLRDQWAGVLKNTKLEGTDTGARVAATLEQYGAQMQNAMRETRAGAMKVAHALTRNYATLVSGVLIGLSEALRATPVAKAAARPAAKPGPAKPTPAAKPGPAKPTPAAKPRPAGKTKKRAPAKKAAPKS